MNPRRSHRSRHLLLALLALAAIDACAQQYPSKPIRIVVPYPPGGGNDILARSLGQKLTEAWGQAVVIDNRGGAAGGIGAEVAARALPDGYTLMVCSSAPLAINPHVYRNLRYDSVKDFAPITLAASAPLILVVHPSVPATSVKELIAVAKTAAKQLNYSSSGAGSTTHLAGLLFAQMAELDLVHVPYKGAAPATNDILAGQIQMRFSAILPVMPHVRAGKLRALALTGARPFAPLPEMPLVAETLPGFVVDAWYAVLAPAGTSREIITKLNTEIVRALRSPEIKARLAADGSEAVGSTPEELAQAIRVELMRWEKVAKQAGAHVD